MGLRDNSKALASKNVRRTSDWLRQAEAALRQAKDSAEGGHYWASCFFAHQAAGFAAKAYLASLGAEARGHSVAELLQKAKELGEEPPEGLLRSALSLDRHYLQARYVNAFYSGAPVDYYTMEDAKRALEEAEALVSYFKKKAGGPR